MTLKEYTLKTIISRTIFVLSLIKKTTQVWNYFRETLCSNYSYCNQAFLRKESIYNCQFNAGNNAQNNFQISREKVRFFFNKRNNAEF